MKTNSWKDLLLEVQEKGVVVEEQLATRIQEENAIKYVFLKVVAILGSLLAMGFFFGFLFLTIGNSLGYASFLFFGILLYAISFLGNKKTEPALRDGVFVATYISAVVCILAACIDLQWNERNNLLGVIVLSILGFLLFKSKIIQFVSVLGLYYGLVYYLSLIHWGYATLVLFWFVFIAVYLLLSNELTLKTTSKFWSQKYSAVLNACFIILFLELIQNNISLINPANWINRARYFDYHELGHYIYLSCAGLVLIGLTYLTSKQMELKMSIQNKGLVIGGSSLFILGIAYFMYGFGMPLVISLFLVLWSYQFRFHKGVVLAILTLIVSLIAYYYYLSVSLLTKSLILMGCGLFFLGLFVIYNQRNREK